MEVMKVQQWCGENLKVGLTNNMTAAKTIQTKLSKYLRMSDISSLIVIR